MAAYILQKLEYWVLIESDVQIGRFLSRKKALNLLKAGDEKIIFTLIKLLRCYFFLDSFIDVNFGIHKQ